MSSFLASMLFGTMFMLYLIGLPALYFYAVQTCPPAMTFNAKKELKRVLRGHHLPDTHPDKPQGMWEEWTARITATLTTELATFPGYEVQQHNLFDAVIGVKVTVPTANLEAYWIGAFSKWHYVYSRELEPRNAAAGVGTGTAGARASTSRR
uniref:Uncharacterized protein n=1 Tax=Craspedostauros australis TaxID=1486917 RepID=A0A7R9WTR3_9STRA